VTTGKAMAQAATVVIVDDETILCELLERRLGDEPGLSCAGTATSPHDAKRLVVHHRPRVILLDIRLEPGLDALALGQDLKRASPTSELLIWTEWIDRSANRADEFRLKVRALRSGASEWINKGDGLSNLIDRIRAAVEREPSPLPDDEPHNPIEASLGDFLGPPDLAGRDPLIQRAEDGLTPTERRAAAIAARGLEGDMTIEQIARTSHMSPATLRAHLKNVYAKWGVHGQAAFAAEARRLGVV